MDAASSGCMLGDNLKNLSRNLKIWRNLTKDVPRASKSAGKSDKALDLTKCNLGDQAVANASSPSIGGNQVRDEWCSEIRTRPSSL